MQHIRPYLRASTDEQDASRARQQLEAFIGKHAPGRTASAWYVENESGAKLDRPELNRLIHDASLGDILLIEQVDRLSRLSREDREKLFASIKVKKIRVVSLDLPISYMALDPSVNGMDEMTMSMMDAVNDMMLQMFAAFARKDYEDRRRRQGQGIAKAHAEGKYKGRKADTERNARLRKMLEAGISWSVITTETKASRSTLAAIAKQIKLDRESGGLLA